MGIIAHRYGWEPDGKKSITWMEYDTATERLMFLINSEIPVNPQKDYVGPTPYRKRDIGVLWKMFLLKTYRFIPSIGTIINKFCLNYCYVLII